MANSWRALAYGSFNSGPWDGEIATIGFSGACRDSGSFTSGAIDDALPEFAAVPSGGTDTSTHMNWSFGSSGIGGWTEANQMAIGEVLWEYLDDIRTAQCDAFSWKEVRVSAINANGTVVNGASVGTFTSGLASGSAQTMPPQVALVSSLVTGGRGPRNRGRLYIPAHAPGTSTGMVVSSVQQTTVNNAAKTAILAFNGITGIRCAVVSRTHATYSDVVLVKVGNQLDTQRRRREGVKEVYTSLAV